MGQLLAPRAESGHRSDPLELYVTLRGSPFLVENPKINTGITVREGGEGGGPQNLEKWPKMAKKGQKMAFFPGGAPLKLVSLRTHQNGWSRARRGAKGAFLGTKNRKSNRTQIQGLIKGVGPLKTGLFSING